MNRADIDEAMAAEGVTVEEYVQQMMDALIDVDQMMDGLADENESGYYRAAKGKLYLSDKADTFSDDSCAEYTPVSYTHLDVYKRQFPDLAGLVLEADLLLVVLLLLVADLVPIGHRAAGGAVQMVDGAVGIHLLPPGRAVIGPALLSLIHI